jgi:glycerophosphoryl diester phosphodiesterase
MQLRPKPFWNIAHAVNGVKYLESMFAQGANALESDMQYDVAGIPTVFYHGQPCDAFRDCEAWERIDTLINAVKGYAQSATYGPKFNFFMFDNKLPNPMSEKSQLRAARHTAGLIETLLTGTQIRVLVSVPHERYFKFIDELNKKVVEKQLQSRVGFELSEPSTGFDVVQLFRDLDIKNVWLSKGVTNWISDTLGSPVVKAGLSDYMNRRDAKDPKKQFGQKVYTWTVDLPNSVHAMAAMGLDGVISNEPEVVTEQVGTFPDLRLATRDDNPFHFVESKRQDGRFQSAGCSYFPGNSYYYCQKSCPSMLATTEKLSSNAWCWTSTYCGKGAHLCNTKLPCWKQDQENRCQ